MSATPKQFGWDDLNTYNTFEYQPPNSPAFECFRKSNVWYSVLDCFFLQERDGELLAESDEFTYECGVRQKYPILFDEPVALQAGRWYVAWARVSGPSSDCGSNGQSQVTTEDQV